MPSFEYFCKKCQVVFEELFLLPDESKNYLHSYPCKKCKNQAERIISKSNFTFTAPPGKTHGTGVHGQSGVHDLDYPVLDKAVGRSAEKKWSIHNERQNKRNEVRKKYGNRAIASIGGKDIPMEKPQLDIREKAMRLYKKAKEME